MYIRLLTDTAKVPTRANGSDGYDVYADEVIQCDGYIKVGLGFAAQIPSSKAALLLPRDDMNSKTPGLKNAIGLINSDFHDEWVIKTKLQGMTAARGDKIARFVLVDIDTPDIDIDLTSCH